MPVTYRPGTLDDTDDLYDIFAQSLAHSIRSDASTGSGDWEKPYWFAPFRERNRLLFAHLAETAEACWIAEDDGVPVGYARATFHDGVRQLTDFFVRPQCQSAGIGRELLQRAFPATGARLRTIVATLDIRAVVRYVKAGTTPRALYSYLTAAPQPVSVETDLVFSSVEASPETLAALRAVDARVLGFDRSPDHEFLLNDRRCVLLHRGSNVVGYGYVGRDSGPFALLDPADFPAVLAWAETEAHGRGVATFGVNVPLNNRAALDHLIARGYRFDEEPGTIMSDRPFGNLEQYLLPNPPFFL